MGDEVSDAVERQEEVNRRLAQILEPKIYLVIGGTSHATVKVRELTDELRGRIEAKLAGIQHSVKDWSDTSES